MLVKNPSSVRYVTKDLLKIVYVRYTLEYILVKKHSNVRYVTKDLLLIINVRYIQDYILVKNLSSVRYVGKNFLTIVIIIKDIRGEKTFQMCKSMLFAYCFVPN